MFDRELAYLSCEFIELLTNIFQSKKISQEAYVTNTILKARYLEEYIKNNKDNNENIKIIKLLINYNVALKTACTSFR